MPVAAPARSLFPVLLAVLLAGGCTAVSTGASIVSLMATKKTITDHVVSFATEMDCSTIALERGEPYCTDPNAPQPQMPLYHCYRSLGEITCYETEDPFNNGHLEVR
ncbi:MAG: hypothetical protein R3F55_01950 [Alphaproteobacteria bacterium]